PHTAQTHHLINAERLKLMKPTAVLVNTARGELVDEAALADAIRDQRIGGAAIDVFAVEPLPPEAPLRRLDRVILTPHLAASTAEAQERVSVEICGAVRDALLAGDLSFALTVPGSAASATRARRAPRNPASRPPSASRSRRHAAGRASRGRSSATATGASSASTTITWTSRPRGGYSSSGIAMCPASSGGWARCSAGPASTSGRTTRRGSTWRGTMPSPRSRWIRR